MPTGFHGVTWYVLLAYAMLGGAWGVVIPRSGNDVALLRQRAL